MDLKRFDAYREALPVPVRYLLVPSLVIVAFLIRMFALPLSAGAQFVTFYPAVALAFYLCGFWPGVLALFLAAAAGYISFFPPFFSLAPRYDAIASVAIFIPCAFVIGYLISRVHEAQKQAGELDNKLAAKQDEENAIFAGLMRRDSLTGLPNRLAATERLRLEFVRMKRSRVPYAVMMIDIDDFNAISATHGHAIGDDVLKTYGQLLRSTLRENDFVARFGDEQFLILLPGTALEQVDIVVDKIRAAVAAAPHEIAGEIAINIGAAAATPEQSGERVAADEADAALFAAKSARHARAEPESALASPSV
jgi:diguanylate cyclase (GGDEF)-like protein